MSYSEHKLNKYEITRLVGQRALDIMSDPNIQFFISPRDGEVDAVKVALEEYNGGHLEKYLKFSEVSSFM